MKRAITWIACICFSALAQAQLYSVQKQTNLVYDTVNGVSLKLDLYKPVDDGVSLRPLVVMIHGGCFTSGSKSEGGVTGIATIAMRLAQDGFVVIAPDYRLAPNFPYPAALNDVRMALRWARQNTSLRIDQARVASYGQSAGSTLAAMLGVQPVYNRSAETDQYATRVNAVVDFYGRMDFTHDQYAGDLSKRDCAEEYLGMKRETNPALFQEASVLPYVDSSSSEFFIFHGTSDPVVLPLHSLRLHQALLEAARPATLVLKEDGGHGASADNTRLARVLLKRKFGMPYALAENSASALRIDSGNQSTESLPYGFVADQYYQGGSAYTYPPSTPAPEDGLSKTVRSSSSSFSYSLNNPWTGLKKIRMRFNDPQSAAAGERQTDIEVCDEPLFLGHDVLKFVARGAPLDQSIYVDTASRTLNIKFTRRAADTATVSAIEYIPMTLGD